MSEKDSWQSDDRVNDACMYAMVVLNIATSDEIRAHKDDIMSYCKLSESEFARVIRWFDFMNRVKDQSG